MLNTLANIKLSTKNIVMNACENMLCLPCRNLQATINGTFVTKNGNRGRFML